MREFSGNVHSGWLSIELGEEFKYSASATLRFLIKAPSLKYYSMFPRVDIETFSAMTQMKEYSFLRDSISGESDIREDNSKVSMWESQLLDIHLIKHSYHYKLRRFSEFLAMENVRINLFLLPIFPPSSHSIVSLKLQYPTKPVEKAALTTKGLQERKTQLLNGTTVEN